MKKIGLLLTTLWAMSGTAQNAGQVQVLQSPEIENLLNAHIHHNASNPAIAGYRIRIYRNNEASSRQKSEEVLTKFQGIYPTVRAYRSYDNPYFKVAVGDFRTKDEALYFLNEIKSLFPKSFIIQENINFPQLYTSTQNAAGDSEDGL
ncbi:hypothetical protein AGMMS4956_19880 [Bacteroidia bacterium]|nr:hypothetical protein AGMMS4956_19880 [Bacteroidia bacterium]